MRDPSFPRRLQRCFSTNKSSVSLLFFLFFFDKQLQLPRRQPAFIYWWNAPCVTFREAIQQQQQTFIISVFKEPHAPFFVQLFELDSVHTTYIVDHFDQQYLVLLTMVPRNSCVGNFCTCSTSNASYIITILMVSSFFSLFSWLSTGIVT